jgi:hypothetical protein
MKSDVKIQYDSKKKKETINTKYGRKTVFSLYETRRDITAHM